MLSNKGRGGGRGKKIGSCPKINSVAKLYNQLKGKRSATNVTASTTTTIKVAASSSSSASSGVTKVKNCRSSKVYPTWQNYENTLKSVDNLKIQLPFFGSDRLFDQFYKLIDVRDAHDTSMPSGDMLVDDVDDECYEDEDGDNDVVVDDDDDEDEDVDMDDGGGGGGGLVTEGSCRGGEEEDEDYCDDDHHQDDDDVEEEEVNISSFYICSFDELFKRYLLRALVSPFDIGLEYSYEATDTTTSISMTATNEEDGDDFSSYSVGLANYLERAVNLFGKQAVNILQFRQFKPFLLQDKGGATVGVRAVSSLRNQVKRDRRKCLLNYHQECAKKIHELGIEHSLSLPNHSKFAAGGASCGCCLTATRVFLLDSNIAAAENATILKLTKCSAQTHVLFNVGDVLYRPFLSDEELVLNFDIRLACRGLKNNEQSRGAVLKTERVQRMSFYRRIYGVHAALYALVNWLWYRQVVRHRNLYDARSCDDDIPPIVLTLPKRMSPMFVTVNTVFLEILLQKRRLLFHYL